MDGFDSLPTHPRCCSSIKKTNIAVFSLEKVTDADLKKRLNELVDLDDWADKCAACGRLDLLHRGSCTRTEKDSPEDLVRIWTEFKKRMKTIVRWSKSSKGG